MTRRTPSPPRNPPPRFLPTGPPPPRCREAGVGRCVAPRAGGGRRRARRVDDGGEHDPRPGRDDHEGVTYVVARAPRPCESKIERTGGAPVPPEETRCTRSFHNNSC